MFAGLRTRRAEERGAVAVFTALLALSLTFAAGLAVDIGMQRVARADMQSLADVVALDLSRELDGVRTGAQYTNLQVLADQSRDRNTSTLGATPVVTPTLGTFNAATGVFAPLTTPGDVPNAVQVNATTQVKFLFGVLARGPAGRNAIATASPSGCMKIGSSVLDGQLLGVKLGIGSYQGLAGLNLQLGALATALNVGTTDQLLATTVSLGTLLTAVVTAAANDSDPANNSTASVLTSGILGSISGNTTLQQVNVGQFLSIGQGDDAALASTVSILGLVTGAAYVANGANAIAVPGLSLPTGTTVSASIIQPPKIACGPRGIATTSQVQLQIKQDLGLTGFLGALLGTLTLNAKVDLGTATGGITSVHCTAGVPDRMDVHVDELAAAKLSATAHTTTLFGLVGADVSLIPGPATGGSTGPYSINLSNPVNGATNYVPTPSGNLVLPTATTAQVSLLGLGVTTTSLDLNLGGLGDLVTKTIVPGLGLRVGGADLYAVSAGCAIPELVG